jgi:3-deoxy-D-manno-octulosonic-acid transferase
LDFKINDLGVFIYNLFLTLFAIGIRLTAIVNPKAKSWLLGRRKFPEIPNAPKTIWMHCASLGEFEQGRPVLEAIREKYPNYRIILTFFSPSGYESRKNYKGVDAVLYLPSDSANNAERFLEMIKPSPFSFSFNISPSGEIIKEWPKVNLPL